jgi:anaerobic magnesium-protoporphyrin IX monomethyl ester cyclase
MKVLLFYADDSNVSRYNKRRTEFPPTGLLYIASSINRERHEVTIVELSDLNHLDNNTKFDIVGLSINTAYSFNDYLNKINEIRGRASYIIAGGQFASVYYNEVLEKLKVDAIVRGEGEGVINQLIDNIHNAERDKIEGIITHKNKGRPSKLLRIVRLDDLKFPARDLLDERCILLNHRVVDKNIYSISFITSRGCPYKCAFCGNLYKKVFFRSPENVEAELISLIQGYNIQHVTFLDENLMLNESHLYGICNVLKELKLSWTCNARVDSFTNEKVEFMKLSGCIEIKYGIESGDESILGLMGKDITLKQIKSAIVGTHLAGLKAKGFILFGFPSENKESIRKTISLLAELRPFLYRINLFNFVPLHNSRCFNNPEKFGITLRDKVSDYTFYAQFKKWWGTEEEYFALLKEKKDLEDFISKNFSGKEPIVKNNMIWEKVY